jgi:hypothetical protein
MTFFLLYIPSFCIRSLRIFLPSYFNEEFIESLSNVKWPEKIIKKM